MTRVIWDKLVDMSDDTPDMIPRAEAEAMVEAALKEAAECCTAQLQNTAMLMSNPPQSSAAWDARNAIRALITPDAQAALDWVKRKAYVDGSNAGWTTGQKAERDRCAKITEGYLGCAAIAAAIREGGE